MIDACFLFSFLLCKPNEFLELNSSVHSISNSSSNFEFFV